MEKLDITCGHCNKPSPMREWVLVQPTMLVLLDTVNAEKIMGVKNGQHDKPLEQCSLICPECEAEQSIALHKQFAEIKSRVAHAGLAFEILFSMIRRK